LLALVEALIGLALFMIAGALADWQQPLTPVFGVELFVAGLVGSGLGLSYGLHRRRRRDYRMSNRRELGRAFRGLAVFAILAAAAAVGASFASGVFQVILIVLAILLFAIVAWGGMWTMVAVILSKVDRRWSSHR
jgi:hypothetical protein